jgi:aryl-alcohol dehydrogenase-like predicted oxidoreductase
MAEIMRTGRIDTVQISYNVMEREVEKEILPLAESMGIGVIVMRPVGHGILINRLESPPDLTPLREFGIETWGQALMARLISNPAVSVLIPATTKPERVKENSGAGERVLPKEAREYVVREAERCLKPGQYTMG